jgi:predicted acetyltransferase
VTADFRDAPLDEQAVTRIGDRGLELRLVDTDDRDAFGRYIQVEMRGFLGNELAPEYLDQHLAGMAYRRCTAVYDPGAPDPLSPVATVNSFVTELTLPGERAIEGWAVSGVTVAPTHRRRGIQRQLMEAELRTAAALGIPLSMLTVSESPIYGRYGYGSAALAADYVVDTTRLGWTGRMPEGRLDYVPVRRFREEAPVIHERARLRRPGDVAPWDLRWDQICGFASADGDVSGKRRAVRYTDAAGEARGMLLYSTEGGEPDFTRHTAVVHFLIAETDDAYAALWRFLLELDLVSEVRMELGSVDEPMRWQVSDFRGVRVDPYDMQYLRILDVAASLTGRGYDAPVDLTLEVSDPLGFATGTWWLRVGVDGGARVEAGDGGLPDLRLGVVELSALLLGGVDPRTLAAAGRIAGEAEALDAFARALRPSATPALSIWY